MKTAQFRFSRCALLAGARPRPGRAGRAIPPVSKAACGGAVAERADPLRRDRSSADAWRAIRSDSAGLRLK